MTASVAIVTLLFALCSVLVIVCDELAEIKRTAADIRHEAMMAEIHLSKIRRELLKGDGDDR